MYELKPPRAELVRSVVSIIVTQAAARELCSCARIIVLALARNHCAGGIDRASPPFPSTSAVIFSRAGTDPPYTGETKL
jgi:hypothetical protein